MPHLRTWDGMHYDAAHQPVLNGLARFFGKPVKVSRDDGDAQVLTVAGVSGATAFRQLQGQLGRFGQLVRSGQTSDLIMFWLYLNHRQELTLEPAAASQKGTPQANQQNHNNYPEWRTYARSKQEGIMIPSGRGALLWPAIIEKA